MAVRWPWTGGFVSWLWNLKSGDEGGREGLRFRREPVQAPVARIVRSAARVVSLLHILYPSIGQRKEVDTSKGLPICEVYTENPGVSVEKGLDLCREESHAF